MGPFEGDGVAGGHLHAPLYGGDRPRVSQWVSALSEGQCVGSQAGTVEVTPEDTHVQLGEARHWYEERLDKPSP
ncbi:hypothetical protein ACLESD_31945 [Pyxidicoccus sp. 3LFB2]